MRVEFKAELQFKDNNVIDIYVDSFEFLKRETVINLPEMTFEVEGIITNPSSDDEEQSVRDWFEDCDNLWEKIQDYLIEEYPEEFGKNFEAVVEQDDLEQLDYEIHIIEWEPMDNEYDEEEDY